MTWASTALILTAFAVATLGVWFVPSLLDWLGLGEFAFVGQVCVTILALSVLEAAFARLPPSPEDASPDPH